MRGVTLAVLALAACGHHAGDDKTVATIDGEVTALAGDATSLYAGVMKLGQTSVVKIAKTGGAPAALVAKPGLVNGLAVTGGTLAWAGTSVDSDDGSGATVITGAAPAARIELTDGVTSYRVVKDHDRATIVAHAR